MRRRVRAKWRPPLTFVLAGPLAAVFALPMLGVGYFQLAGGVLGRSELPGMVDEWMRGDFSVDPYITHNMGHGQINTAFDLLKAGESIRSVIHYQPSDTMTVNSLPGMIVPE